MADANMQQAVAVQGAGIDIISLGLVTRDGLAGDRAFVDARLAAQDNAVGRDAFSGAHDNGVAGDEVLNRDIHFFTVAQHSRPVRQLLDELVDRGLGASRGVGFQPLADKHDEHRLGGGQILAHGKGGRGGDADRQVCGDALLEQLADRAGKCSIPRKQSQEDCRVDPQDRREQPCDVEQKQDADGRREADVFDPLPRVPVDGMVFANDVQCSSR